MATASRRSRQALTMLVVGLSAAGPGRAVAQQDRNRDDPVARMEYFYRQRAYPLQRVPPGALQAARAAYGARWPAAVRAQRLQAASSLGGWAGFGPSPILSGGARYAGRVTSIAVDLSTSRTIYAGAADGGVWRSVDGGANWTPLTDAECSLDMGSVALDPVAPSIVYAGTGEAAASYDSYFGCGVLRSTDGGMTWTRDRKSTRLNSSHGYISYAVFCLKKKILQFSLLASQNPVCASKTNDPFFINQSFPLLSLADWALMHFLCREMPFDNE